VGEGLVCKGDKLTGFAVAGEDKKFVWADAKIDGENVVVSSEKVAAPKAVRYAWADNPECNLYNKANLPASPFRTDDWPGITEKQKQ
jgi:sialate O-acetylesterase